MTELDQLKAQQAELTKRITAAETEAAQARNAPLIGKCFKFKMRSACYTNCPVWWVYFKVLGLNGKGVTVFSFQRTDSGEYKIEPARFMRDVGGIEVEIDGEEWRREYVGMVAELGGLV